jgi:hypothetical protein
LGVFDRFQTTEQPMPSKSLEERAAEMRERIAKEKHKRNRVPIKVNEPPLRADPAPVAELNPEPESNIKSRHNPTIVKNVDGSSSVTREDLCMLIWSEPVRKLAIRFGISDVAVAKACRKHNIPLPGLGYWTRRQAGQKIKTTSLPKGEDMTITDRLVRSGRAAI